MTTTFTEGLGPDDGPTTWGPGGSHHPPADQQGGTMTCGNCDGTGTYNGANCPHCGGDGTHNVSGTGTPPGGAAPGF